MEVGGHLNENIELDEYGLDAIVTKLDASGALDGTYGTGGHSQVDIGGIFPGGTRDLAVMADGRAVITADFGSSTPPASMPRAPTPARATTGST